MNKLSKVVVPFAIALIAAACSGGLSTQEAYEICGAERESNPAIDEVAFAACVACYEECSDCIVQDTAPATFACPDD